MVRYIFDEISSLTLTDEARISHPPCNTKTEQGSMHIKAHKIITKTDTKGNQSHIRKMQNETSIFFQEQSILVNQYAGDAVHFKTAFLYLGHSDYASDKKVSNFR